MTADRESRLRRCLWRLGYDLVNAERGSIDDRPLLVFLVVVAILLVVLGFALYPYLR